MIVMGFARSVVCFLAGANARCTHPTFVANWGGRDGFRAIGGAFLGRGQFALHPSYISGRTGTIVMGFARSAVCFLAVANARCTHPTFCGDLVWS